MLPDIESHPLFIDIMRQADIIEREWGPVEGELNYQGVLNTAFRLRGESIFTDMVAAPDRARRVLEVVTRDDHGLCRRCLPSPGPVGSRA